MSMSQNTRHSDVFTKYEKGLDRLLSLIDYTSTSYSSILIYQQRLTENIENARLHGDTENLRAERSVIITQLNLMSTSETGITFNDLCNPSKRLNNNSYHSTSKNNLDKKPINIIQVNDLLAYFPSKANEEENPETEVTETDNDAGNIFSKAEFNPEPLRIWTGFIIGSIIQRRTTDALLPLAIKVYYSGRPVLIWGNFSGAKWNSN